MEIIQKNYLINSQQLQLCDAIFVTLREAIIHNQIDHTTRFKEEEIASILKVSRTPVREALRLLQQNEYIVADPEKGYTIKKITLKESIDVTIYTRFLRSSAAEIVARQITRSQLMLLENKKMTKSKLDALNDVKRVSNAYMCHQNFHLSIANLTGNEFLIKESTKAHKKLLMIHYYYTNTMKSDFPASIYMKEHEQLIEAFKNHDSKKAKQTVHKYATNNVIKRMYALNQNYDN